MKLKMTIGTDIFTATLFKNESTIALREMLPMTIKMIELNGNEKYFDLSDTIPDHASIPEKIEAGDLMLYGSTTLVLFYKSFSTSYRYSQLGRIDNTLGLEKTLGTGNVAVTFEFE